MQARSSLGRRSSASPETTPPPPPPSSFTTFHPHYRNLNSNNSSNITKVSWMHTFRIKKISMAIPLGSSDSKTSLTHINFSLPFKISNLMALFLVCISLSPTAMVTPYTFPPPPPNHLNHSNQPFRPPPFHPTANNFQKPPPYPSYREKLINPNPTSIPTINLSNFKPKTPMVWRNSSIIATAKTFETIQNPKTMLNDPDFDSNISISYVGGLSLLLHFQASKVAKDFLYSKKEFMQRWFHSAELWSGQDIISGRIAKVTFHGLPLPLWDKENFNRIAQSFGKLIAGSEASYLDKNLSYSSALILVDSHKKIESLARITHGSKTFLIKVSEADNEWCPNFFNEELSDSDSDEDLEEDSGEPEDESPINVDDANDPPNSQQTNPTLGNPTAPVINEPINVDSSQNIPSAVPPSSNNKPRAHPHNETLQNPTSPPPKPTKPLIPDPSSPPPPPQKSALPDQPTNPCTSRKRPRRFSPSPEPLVMNLDLNTPPPPLPLPSLSLTLIQILPQPSSNPLNSLPVETPTLYPSKHS